MLCVINKITRNKVANYACKCVRILTLSCNRFMICCDHCEEWFHGMCVGITMAQGRQMEKNGQEYVCPKCKGELQNNTEYTQGLGRMCRMRIWCIKLRNDISKISTVPAMCPSLCTTNTESPTMNCDPENDDQAKLPCHLAVTNETNCG